MNDRRFVIDGTNLILIHGRARPELRYLLALCSHLEKKGASFICFFDANTRYVLEAHSSEQLTVFERVLVDPRWSAYLCVVPSGTDADEWILGRARADRADVISNDKYRDRARRHRWIWKRRHPVQAERERILLATLGSEVPVLPNAGDYLCEGA